MLILDSKVLNDHIIKVLELADKKKLDYEKSDLVLFAKMEIMNRVTNPEHIITNYLATK